MRRLGGDGKDKTGKRTPGQQVKPGVTKEYQEEEKGKRKQRKNVRDGEWRE